VAQRPHAIGNRPKKEIVLIKGLVKRAIAKRRAVAKETCLKLEIPLQPELERIKTLPATPLGTGIPTLQIGVYQPFTPQLKDRYELFGRWEAATDGHWLGLSDMEGLWKTPIEDRFLADIQAGRLAAERGRPNEASALFKPERLSLFAGSDITYEKIYLLWLDDEYEPQLFVYDVNGESRYKDLEAYLKAYLAGDISAAESRWYWFDDDCS
jgi:hypothetical protein